jgi:hypothetical protein
VIMLSALFFFNEPFTNIVTITFTALVITELLNVFSEVFPIHLIKHNLDKQTELEDGDLFDPHFLLLYSEHYPSAFLLRYFADDVALFHESACDHPSFMDASAHSQMHHYEARPH